MVFLTCLEEELTRLRRRLIEEHERELRAARLEASVASEARVPDRSRGPLAPARVLQASGQESAYTEVPRDDAGLVELENELLCGAAQEEKAMAANLLPSAVAESPAATTPSTSLLGMRRRSSDSSTFSSDLTAQAVANAVATVQLAVDAEEQQQQQQQQLPAGGRRNSLGPKALELAAASPVDSLGDILDEVNEDRSARRHRTLMADEGPGCDLNGRRLSLTQIAAQAAAAAVETVGASGGGGGASGSGGRRKRSVGLADSGTEADDESNFLTQLEAAKLVAQSMPQEVIEVSTERNIRRASVRRHSLRRASTQQQSLQTLLGIAPSADDALGFTVLPIWMFGRGNQKRKMGAQALREADMFEEGVELEEFGPWEEWMRKFMLNPNSVMFLGWNLIGLLLIGYDCVVIPIEVFDPERNAFMEVMEWIVRFFWTFNMGCSFLTGFMRTDGALEMRPSKVARQYITTWLGLDLFVVGFDWFELIVKGRLDTTGGWNRYGAALRGMRMIRTVRLFRIIRAPQITKALTEYIPCSEQVSLVATIAKIMLIFLWMTHIVACMWYGLSHYLNSGSRRWVVQYNTDTMNVPEKYALSLHWSLLTFSGDDGIVDPQNLSERVFAMIVLYIAFVVSASYVGSITTSMTRFQFIVSEQSLKISELRRFLQDYGISRHLAVRVQRNAQHAMMEEKTKAPEDRIELLKVLSQPVLIEVHFEIHSKVLMTHPFFLLYNDVNPAGIRKVCHMAVSTLSLHTGDVLFSEMEVPVIPRMFFVVNGDLRYMQEKSTLTMQPGMCLSEGTLWTRWTHCGTTRSSTETRLLVLDAEAFQDVVSSFPTDHAGNYATAFCKRLNDIPHEKLSDMTASTDEVYDMISQAFPIMEDEESEEDCTESVRTSVDSAEAPESTWKTVASTWLPGVAGCNADKKPSSSGSMRPGRKSSKDGLDRETTNRLKNLVMELERRQLGSDDPWRAHHVRKLSCSGTISRIKRCCLWLAERTVDGLDWLVTKARQEYRRRREPP